MTRLSNASLALRQKVDAIIHPAADMRTTTKALQMHLSRAFSHVLVSLPRQTDPTAVITLQAFPTLTTSTITRHDAHTTKTR
ncbi:hypothetical protein FOBRF1_012457 [Fusarium oxysporum]